MTKKPKILLVLHLPPPVHGASMVGKYIHDSKLINSEFDCHYVNLTTATSLEDIGKGGVKKLWTFCKKLKEIYQAIRKIQPDYIYVTPNTAKGPFYKDFVIVEWCKLWSRKKTILHFHNKGISTRQEHWIDDKMYRRFFKNVEVILLGKPLYEDMRKYVKEENVHYCPNGIPEKKDDSRIEISGAGDLMPEVKILFLSNLLVAKGVLELLDALRLLKKKGCKFVCDFVGGETAEIDVKRMKIEIERRELEEGAVYHGKKYGNEKNAYFEKADLFCFPTFYEKECFPLVLLEAMQFGLPCISTNEGAISCIIDNGVTGFIVDKSDTLQLAKRIELLLKDQPLREKMGEAGKWKFEQEFTIKQFEKRFVEAIKECMSLC